ASSADARRRHHGYYGGYRGRRQSRFDEWRRPPAAPPNAQKPRQRREQNPQANARPGPPPAPDQEPQPERRHNSGQPRAADRARQSYDRRRVRYDDWRRARDERRARYEDWRRGRERDDWRRLDEREDWTRRREAERGDAALRRTRGGPFAAVVEKLVRGCGAQGAEFENWPFDAIAQTVAPDPKHRTPLPPLPPTPTPAAPRPP